MKVTSTPPVKKCEKFHTFSSFSVLTASLMNKFFCFCHCNDTISCACLGEAAWVRSVHLVAVSPELPPLVCHGEHAGLAWPRPPVHRGAREHKGSRQSRKIKNERNSHFRGEGKEDKKRKERKLFPFVPYHFYFDDLP